MHDILFILFVVGGFMAWFLATWPVTYAERIARGCFLAAALVWGFGLVGTR